MKKIHHNTPAAIPAANRQKSYKLALFESMRIAHDLGTAFDICKNVKSRLRLGDKCNANGLKKDPWMKNIEKSFEVGNENPFYNKLNKTQGRTTNTR